MPNKSFITSKNMLIFLLVVVVVISAFLLLDFKAATSQTNSNTQSNSYSTNNTGINFSKEVFVYIDGNGSISKGMGSEIIKGFNNAGMQISQIDEFKNKYQKPVFIVTIRNSDILYTPFYSTASIEAFYFYSSKGDTKYYKGFKKGENPTVRFYSNESKNGEYIKQGALSMKDSTKGLISLNAYTNHLEKNLATNIIKSFLPVEQQWRIK
ncbi:conserved hypothetical protein [Methanohalobium evestigatum Z-7303]|uniref:Uncharacterized protein n=1 Tax=Methanohalobium evestigatum (strain ATCC BAA-1072 / DSM 3721 / NBRC 107634 / OCM 161 / Z-7303) TaxID=644295 RepID=D7EA30_METEZ|nr:hypothetical protein [Methanohalobium evestigatum]ADI74701.1 conserved hypothetical protein [Methanohalobium evestigatum Z-7303]